MRMPIKMLAAMVLLLGAAAISAKEYKFTVSNTSTSRITGIHVSEDGKTWGNFNVGKGIAANSESELVWDESTNSSGCEWLVKATYADGSESEAATFDFCEEDLTLEFGE